jgi:glycosyltransferase involved in cell wall biosynthesis
MVPKSRCLIFIVAYQAETTIADVVKRIPSSLAERYDVEVLIIDDSSKDRTFETSYALTKHAQSPFKIHVLFNPVNQGYGGNQKLGYHFAIAHNYDFVALVHGDGQYAPECLPALMEPLENGDAAAVFGSRMITPSGALRGGMPMYKFLGNKTLTWTQNKLLRSNLSEFHSGYRLYSVKALKAIPFEHNSNDFHFDTEIIIQLMVAKLRIVELPIPTFYGDEICRVNGIRYAANVVRTTFQARLQEYSLFYDRKYDCAPPAPQPSKLGFPSPQSFVAKTVSASAKVLDLGFLISHPAADDWNETLSKIPIKEQDYVLLLDVIEHLALPEAFLDCLRSQLSLSPKAELIISTANVAFVVTRVMLLLGYFNYSKRGILDLTHTRLFTRRSLKAALEQAGFNVLETKAVPAPFPLALGAGRLSSMLLAINSFLISMLPGLFGYQIILRAKARPTVASLLHSAYDESSARAESLETAV